MLTVIVYFFFVKQKTAYAMRISDLSSDVCSSDLKAAALNAWNDHLTAIFDGARKRAARTRIVSMCWQPWSMNMSGSGGRSTSWTRTEERRVGEECVSTCR